MRNVFLDTNILMDLLVRENFSSEIKLILERGLESGIQFSTSFLSVANFAYIIRKNNRKDIHGFLKFICNKFNVIRNDANNILEAIKLEAKDLEDAIQYETAISAKCDCIITRNKKDFVDFSIIPIFTPDEFLKQLNQ